MNAAAQPLKGRPATPPAPVVPSRMTLANVKKGKLDTPWRVLLYGVEGIGKSTLAAATPSPIFIGAEEGTGQLDVARFPSPSTLPEVRDALEVLRKEPHEFQTVVIDTVDWLEPLVWAFVCARDDQANIEAYGYGKGYQVALDEWRKLLVTLDQLRFERGLNVMLLGHSHLRPFKNPEGEDFDRYELMLNAKSGGLLKQWVDAVLFANHETFTKTNERTKRVKGVSTGARYLFTDRTAAFDAKNRYGLPEYMALSWPDVEAAMKASAVDVNALLSEVRRKAAEAGEVDRVEAAITRAAGDVSKLQQLNSWCNTQLSLKAEQAGKQP